MGLSGTGIRPSTPGELEGERMVTVCKTCGTVFECEADEFGKPLEDECNDCWLEHECERDCSECEDWDCEGCPLSQ